MNEFSRRWKKHADPRKWRKIHEGWVGNKRTQFPSMTSFNKVESAVKCCILIPNGQKVNNINPESEIDNS